MEGRGSIYADTSVSVCLTPTFTFSGLSSAIGKCALPHGQLQKTEALYLRQWLYNQSPNNMIMGKDCFVVNIACDLDSYAVALFCINMILRGSPWFPVVYISSCKISFETLLFPTGAVTAL